MRRFPYEEISFSASGWLYIFQLGVLHYLQQHFDMKHVKVYGTSGGAIVGCSLCCQYDNLRLASEVIKAKQIQSDNFRKMIEIAHNGCDRICPNDAHKMCNKRLTIFCSEIYKGVLLKSINYNSYNKRQDVVNVLKATCCLPFFNGKMSYLYDNKWLIDGVFTCAHYNNKNDNCLMVSHRRNCRCGCYKSPKRTIMPEFDIPRRFSIFPVSEEFLKLLFYHGYTVAVKHFKQYHYETLNINNNVNVLNLISQTNFESINHEHLSIIVKNSGKIRKKLQQIIQDSEEQFYDTICAPIKYVVVSVYICIFIALVMLMNILLEVLEFIAHIVFIRY